MRWTLNASASVTARGRPSGTATTSTVTLVMKSSRNVCTLAISMMSSPASLRCNASRPQLTSSTAPAASMPKLPICCASWSSLSTRKELRLASTWPPPAACSSASVLPVDVDSVPEVASLRSLLRSLVCAPSITIRLILPCWLLGPTATTSMRPKPSCTFDPDSSKGSTLGDFDTSSASPVMWLSSTLSGPPLNSSPSVGTMSPVSTSTTSPTSSSNTLMDVSLAPRTTRT
mmetsp:Transcript_14580/g.42641  ORF Transcript_14580/g.42641 Transcript_14580/m.42641 type:complete len:231 (-) Transcript_14580:1264-1956(-)